jgi:hypothetical protein
MKSDLNAARLHLERAFYYLCGDDPFSRAARKSINVLMDEIIVVGDDSAFDFERSEPLSDKRNIEADRGFHRGKSFRGQHDPLVG